MRRLTDDDIYLNRIMIDRISLAIQALEKGKFDVTIDLQRGYVDRLQEFIVTGIIEDLAEKKEEEVQYI